jgi:hypothetical protein
MEALDGGTTPAEYAIEERQLLDRPPHVRLAPGIKILQSADVEPLEDASRHTVMPVVVRSHLEPTRRHVQEHFVDALQLFPSACGLVYPILQPGIGTQNDCWDEGG